MTEEQQSTLSPERRNADNIASQMRKGILEYCILLLLSRGEFYTADLLSIFRQAGLLVVEGTIYPLISRLRRWELLEVRIVESHYAPPRKYYKLSPQGFDLLQQLEGSWLGLEQTVAHIRTLEIKQESEDLVDDEYVDLNTNDL